MSFGLINNFEQVLNKYAKYSERESLLFFITILKFCLWQTLYIVES